MPDVRVTAGLETSAVKTGLAQMTADFRQAEAAVTRSLDHIFSLRTLAVIGVEEGIRSVVEYASHIQDLTERYATGKQQQAEFAVSLQQIGHAAELNGASLDDVAQALNRLARARALALGGDQASIAALARLNITLDDVKDSNISLAQLLLKTGTSSLNAADMFTVLGRNSLTLRSTLIKLADGFQELGSAIDPDTVSRIDNLEDRMTSFLQRLKVFVGGNFILPVFEPILHALEEITNGFPTLRAVLERDGEQINKIATQIFTTLGKLSSGDFSGAKSGLKDLGQTLNEGFSIREIGANAEQAAAAALSPLDKQIEKVKAEIAAIEGKTVEVKTETDTSQVDALQAQIDAIKGPTTAKVLTQAETEQVSALQAQIDAIKGPTTVRVLTEADTAKVAELQAQIDAIKQPVTARVLTEADTAKVAALQAQVDAIKVPVTAKVLTEADTAKVAELQAQIDAIKVPVTARVLTEADTAKVAELQAQIDAIKVPVTARVLTEADTAKVAELQAQIDAIKAPVTVKVLTEAESAQVEALQAQIDRLKEPTTARVTTEVDSARIEALQIEIDAIKGPTTARVLTETDTAKVEALQAEIDRLKQPTTARVTTEVDSARIEALQSEIDAIKGPITARVLTEADTAKVEALQAQIDAIKVPVTAKVLTEADNSRLVDLQAELDAIKAPVTVRVLTEADTAKVTELQAQINALKVPVTARVLTEADTAKVAELQAQIDAIRAPVTAHILTEADTAKVEELQRQIDAIKGPITARVVSETDAAKVDALQAEIDALKGPTPARVVAQADGSQVTALQEQIAATEGPTVAQVVSQADAAPVARLQTQIAAVKGPTTAKVQVQVEGADKLAQLKAQLASLEARKTRGAEPDAGGAAIEEEQRKQEALANSIATLQESIAAKRRSDEAQLNALLEKGVQLYEAQNAAQASGSKTAFLEAQKAYLDNEVKVTDLSNKITKDTEAAEKKIADERERALEAAQKDLSQAGEHLAASREETKEIGLQLQGREDLAEQAKIAFDFDKQIAEANAAAEQAAADAKEAKSDEERRALEAVEQTNRALAQQLGLEKNAALAAQQKAEAEKQAAAISEVRHDTTAAKLDLEAIEAENAALAAQLGGHEEIANAIRTEFQETQKIKAAQEDANKIWEEMAVAYEKGNTALGDELAKLGNIKQSIADQLALQLQVNQALQQAVQLEQARVNLSNTAARAQSLGIQGVGSQPSIFGVDEKGQPAAIGTTGATLTQVAQAQGASPEAIAIAQLRDQLQYASGQNPSFLEQLRRNTIVQDAAAQAEIERVRQSQQEQQIQTQLLQARLFDLERDTPAAAITQDLQSILSRYGLGPTDYGRFGLPQPVVVPATPAPTATAPLTPAPLNPQLVSMLTNITNILQQTKITLTPPPGSI